MQAIDHYRHAFAPRTDAVVIAFPEFHIAPVAEHPDPKNDQRMIFTVWQRGRLIGTAMTTKLGLMRYSFALNA